MILVFQNAAYVHIELYPTTSFSLLQGFSTFVWKYNDDIVALNRALDVMISSAVCSVLLVDVDYYTTIYTSLYGRPTTTIEGQRKLYITLHIHISIQIRSVRTFE